MTSPLALPALGISLLAAVAAGIHLGESAVAAIDPVHFQGPALHPRDRGAALDERALLAERPAPPPSYGWEQGHAARAADCGDCDLQERRGARAYSAVVPYFGDTGEPPEREAYRAEAAQVRVFRGSTDSAEPIDSPKRRIERYAHFPLGYEEAAFAAPLAEEQPVEDEEIYP